MDEPNTAATPGTAPPADNPIVAMMKWAKHCLDSGSPEVAEQAASMIRVLEGHAVFVVDVPTLSTDPQTVGQVMWASLCEPILQRVADEQPDEVAGNVFQGLVFSALSWAVGQIGPDAAADLARHMATAIEEANAAFNVRAH